MKYHPNYFNKTERSRRNRGQLDIRLNRIKDTIKKGGKMLDIGCESGYNSFGLRDCFEHTDAFDMVDTLISRAENIAQENNVTNISFETNDLSDYLHNNSAGYSVVLYLSVHHHVIAKYGLDSAGKMLSDIASRCQDQLFIDMGQRNEKKCHNHSWWNMLPESDDVENWLKDYLEKHTSMTADNIGSTRIHKASRYLWKLERP
jgi:hypothetical protein